MFEITSAGKLVLAIALPTTMLFVYWMFKRRKDDEEEDNMNRIATSRQTVIEVKIPSEAVGAVIGRQGSTIKQIQEDSGARVQFKDRDTSNRERDEPRTIVIRGSPEAAQHAEVLVREVIANMPVIRTEEMYVPVKCLGRIIGRNGDSIRQMCRSSKAKIKIDPRGDERDPNSLKLIVITGGEAHIEIAKSLIEEKIQEEEVFRAKIAVENANREHRSTRRRDATETQQQHIPVSRTAFSDVEPWDSSQSETLDESEWFNHKDSFMEVYVSAVENPGHFWVQILSSKAAQLDQLVREMSVHYSQTEPEDPALSTISIGDIVAVPFPHDISWYRARVLGFDDNKVDLYYVDFGDNGLLVRDQVRTLRGDFLSLPFQAIECYLANTKPIDGSWSEQSSIDFEELTYCAQWKVVMAKTIRYKPSEQGLVPCLHIVDTNGHQDVDINAELVRRGYADWDPEPPRASAGGLGDLSQVSHDNRVVERECMALHGLPQSESPSSLSKSSSLSSLKGDNPVELSSLKGDNPVELSSLKGDNPVELSPKGDNPVELSQKGDNPIEN